MFLVWGVIEVVGKDQITECQAMAFEVYHYKEWRFLKGFRQVNDMNLA